VRGGKRPGAGRKKGSVSKATVYRQEMMARAAAEGISPLEVMMTAMRKAWDAGDVDKAVLHAVQAAPYMHPKLAAVQHSGDAENPVTMAILTGVPTEQDADGDDQRPEAPRH
jgi:hypothetical protein